MRTGSSSARQDNVDTGFLVAFCLPVQHSVVHVDERRAAAGYDSFFHSSPGGVERVFDAQFALFHFGFGSSADFDDGYAAGQFGQTLLQFFFVEFGSRFFKLCLIWLNAGFDIFLVAGAVDDDRVFFR